jgi:hypothetical protein
MQKGCRDSSRGIYIAYLIQGLILLSAVYSLSIGQYLTAVSSGIAFSLTLVPSLMMRSLRFCLPWGVNLCIAVSLYLHVMGHVADYYIIFAPYYDKLTHFVSSITVAILGFFLAILADRLWDLRLNRQAIVFFVVILTLAMGAVWEIYEFVFDQVFGMNLQHGNTDTMLDLIIDLVGAMIVALFADITLRTVPKEEIISLFPESAHTAVKTDLGEGLPEMAESR